MPPDSSKIRSPASAASANTIQRISSGLRYFLNLSYQAMAASLPGRMIGPGSTAVNRSGAHLHLREGQHAGRIIAEHRLDRRRRNAALLQHRQKVPQHGGVATPAKAREHRLARHVRRENELALEPLVAGIAHQIGKLDVR